MQAVSSLEYTLAALDEALRLYPPVPTALSRKVEDTAGDTIAGQWVPPNVCLKCPCLAKQRLIPHPISTYVLRHCLALY